MSIYELNSDSLVEIEQTTFAQLGIKERQDLQRLLKNKIEVIADDVMVIAEEFGDWEGSNRRIDLLGIDRSANIVVIELKRTEDGGHMELQAIRYAAMLSTMTFEQAVKAFEVYIEANIIEGDAQERMLSFLGWEEPDDDRFAQDVRIILASAEFSKELATAVIWLNERNLDIQCIRMRPYFDGGKTLLDVQQVIPLPEASDYQIKVREKQQKERQARNSSRDMTRYDLVVGGAEYSNLPKRHLVFHVVEGAIRSGINPEELRSLLSWRGNLFVDFDGELPGDEFQEALIKDNKGGQQITKRYFCDEDQLFRHNDKTYSLTNQWGRQTLKAVNTIKEHYPQLDISITPMN